ncbi:MAG: sodium-independent anion transporter, partial [Caldilinea sp.]|nr:sodium-independent anion transporter [Caldilinea sp.]
EAVRLDDGGWEMRDAPKTLTPGQATVIVVQGLDFFAEVPTLDDQMPPTRGAKDAVAVLVLRDMHRISSTAIRWLERYAKNLKAEGGQLILADVNAEVMATLTKSGAVEVLGAENIIPATKRILEAEEQAWDAAHAWLRQASSAAPVKTASGG